MFKGYERDGLSYTMLRLQQRRDELVCRLGSSLRISKIVEWSRTLLFGGCTRSPSTVSLLPSLLEPFACSRFGWSAQRCRGLTPMSPSVFAVDDTPHQSLHRAPHLATATTTERSNGAIDGRNISARTRLKSQRRRKQTQMGATHR